MNRGVTYLPPVDGHDERVLNADATSRIREKEKKTTSVTSQWSWSVSLALRSARLWKLTGSLLNRLQATSALPRGTDVLLYQQLRNVKKRLYLLLGGVINLCSLHLFLFSGQSLQRCVHQAHTYTQTQTHTHAHWHTGFNVCFGGWRPAETVSMSPGQVQWNDIFLLPPPQEVQVNTHQPLDGGKHSEFTRLLLKALSRLWLNPPTHQWHLLEKKTKNLLHFEAITIWKHLEVPNGKAELPPLPSPQQNRLFSVQWLNQH